MAAKPPATRSGALGQFVSWICLVVGCRGTQDHIGFQLPGRDLTIHVEDAQDFDIDIVCGMFILKLCHTPHSLSNLYPSFCFRPLRYP